MTWTNLKTCAFLREMTDNKLMSNAKEAITLVALSAGIGYAVKKAMSKSVTSDPSSSLMNAAEWTGVMLGAIYARDYLIKEKVIPT